MEDLEELTLMANSACIGWKQPYLCYNGLDGFQYHVFVEAIDLHEANTVTISETSYCFPIDPCRSYTVTGTPSVQSYNGTMRYLLVNGLGGKFLECGKSFDYIVCTLCTCSKNYR